MSFAITVYVPECIVMAADSRHSLRVEWKEGGHPSLDTVSSDSMNKVFHLVPQQCGILTYGDCLPGGRPVGSFIERFAEERLEPEDRVTQVAGKLKGFFFNAFPGLDTSFHVAGFEKQGRQSVPFVHVVTGKGIQRVNAKPDGPEAIYGCTWGGEADVMASILLAPGPSSGPLKPPVLWETFSPQDAVDFTLFAVRTTIDAMRFQARRKTVGGPVDVLMITPREGVFIQKKRINTDRI